MSDVHNNVLQFSMLKNYTSTHKLNAQDNQINLELTLPQLT